ncbi:histidine phosphatase superfamily [Aspergillus ambiguus]|uniref:histidine phosphatase family protein n=1 Tax=Aspergillus ambiguus TaxID=176160 RepID=UPI003CCD7F29
MSNVPNSWALIFSLLAAIGAIWYHSGNLQTCLPSCCTSSIFSSPHYASWNSWFHPARSGIPGGRTGPSENDWNLLYHLGGNGPWIEKVGDAELDGIDPPRGCSVDQVHMMSRHAERYPTTSAGTRHLDLINRIQEANFVLNGSLSFLNNWTYFTDDPRKDFDQLTRTGPYAGTLQAFTTGVRFLTRYAHLLPQGAHTRFWASDSERVIESARYFATGLFGLDWESGGKATLEIIPETLDRRADTLTPGDTCLRYLEDTVTGHDMGVNMLGRFQQTYIPPIARRLVDNENNGGLGLLSNLEVYSMQEMCGFETIARGSSPWCDVFTHEDWKNFEYARDLIHYYRAGPGNPYAGTMGWLWLNATNSLLHAGPEAGTMFFSFVHDGDIAPFLTALDILKDDKYDPDLPTTHAVPDRVWRTSSVMPMGGRIVLERMSCSSSAYVRVSINDRTVPLPYCQTGPGRSCPLREFAGHVERRRREVGEYGEVCGLEDVEEGGITFLRQ